MPFEFDAVPRQGQDKRLKPKRVSSDQLFEDHCEVVILHNGREYRLRLTRSGRLILTA
jgi:hemin uptake protein HemP